MKLSRLLYLFWILIILGLSLTPGSQIPDFAFPHADKVGHTVFYGVLAVLGCQVLGDGVRIRRAVAASFVLAVLYGGLLEVSQAVFVPGRSAELTDLLADAIGALAGGICWAFAKRKNRSPRKAGRPVS